MKILKRACVFCLLIALTVTTVLLPRAVTERKQKSLLSKKTYWNYGGRGDTEYTSERLAELCYSSEVYTVLYRSNECDYRGEEESKTRTSCEAMLDEVFKYESSVSEYIKKSLDDGGSYRIKKTVMTVLDGRSVILDITEVNCKGTNHFFSFCFEENTNTLLNFSFYYEKNTEKAESAPIKALEQAVNDYYAKQLNLSDEMYYHQGESGEEYVAFDLGIANKKTDYSAEEEK